MAATRRAYTGAAVSTTTASSIAASGTTSFTITAYTGWPYGTDPFYVVVEPGTASEEKILVTRTGSTDTTINVASDSERGQDGTSAVSHSSGSTVFPVFTAVDADEANAVASIITADTTNSRIGIGTATPALKLHVKGNGDGIRVENGVSTDHYDIYRSAVTGFLEFTGSQSSFSGYDFEVNNGTNVMRINNSGNVGIGDTTPSYKLDVNGDINATGDLRIGGNAIGEWTTWTPTVTAETGTITTLGTVVGRHCTINQLVIGYIDIPITNNGTGAGTVIFTLPSTPAVVPPGGMMGYVREIASTGTISTIWYDTTAGRARIQTLAGTYPGANIRRLVGLFYYEGP